MESAEGAALQDLLRCRRCENRVKAGKHISLLVHHEIEYDEQYIRDRSGRTFGARQILRDPIHGIAAVAIQYRPCGPHVRTRSSDLFMTFRVNLWIVLLPRAQRRSTKPHKSPDPQIPLDIYLPRRIITQNSSLIRRLALGGSMKA